MDERRREGFRINFVRPELGREPTPATVLKIVADLQISWRRSFRSVSAWGYLPGAALPLPGTALGNGRLPLVGLLCRGLLRDSAEMWHHLLAHLLKKFHHLGARGGERRAEVDVFQARKLFLQPLQMFDQFLWGACEPRPQFHVVLDGRHTRLVPAAALGDGCLLLVG